MLKKEKDFCVSRNIILKRKEKGKFITEKDKKEIHRKRGKIVNEKSKRWIIK